MTLVVCLKTTSGIVLASDSRGTIGDPRGLTAINDSQIKIHQIGNCGLAIAGASEMGAVLLDELHKNNDLDKLKNVDDTIDLLVNSFKNYFNKWFHNMPLNQRPGVLFTIAGYRNGRKAEPMIYLLNSQSNFAPQLFINGPCLSGVPQYAVYLVHRYYDCSISLEKGMALAHYLIDETASQDPKVGGPIKISEITPDKGYRALQQEEIKIIAKRNQELNKQMREFFMKGEIK